MASNSFFTSEVEFKEELSSGDSDLFLKKIKKTSNPVPMTINDMFSIFLGNIIAFFLFRTFQTEIIFCINNNDLEIKNTHLKPVQTYKF